MRVEGKGPPAPAAGSAFHASLIVVLLSVGLGQLVRVPWLSVGDKVVAVLPVDVAVAVAVCLGLLEVHRRGSLPLSAPAAWGLGFVVIAAAATVSAVWRLGLPPRAIVVAGSYLGRWGLYFALFPITAALLRADEVGRLLGWFRALVVVFAVFGIVQSLLLPNFAFVVYPDSRLYLDWDPQGHRLVSTFLDPNFAGNLLVLGLCWWGGRFLAGVTAPRWEAAVLLLALLLTFSRGSMLSAVIAALVLVLAHGVSRRVVQALVGAGVTITILIPLLLPLAAEYSKLRLDASALGRVVAWQRALTIWADYPWLGIGFNTMGFALPRFGIVPRGSAGFGLDGGLLIIGALTGLFGLTAYVGLLGSVVRSARAAWRTAAGRPLARAVGYAVAASVAAIVVQAMFLNTLLYSLLLAPVWMLWASAQAVRRAEG